MIDLTTPIGAALGGALFTLLVVFFVYELHVHPKKQRELERARVKGFLQGVATIGEKYATHYWFDEAKLNNPPAFKVAVTPVASKPRERSTNGWFERVMREAIEKVAERTRDEVKRIALFDQESSPEQ